MRDCRRAVPACRRIGVSAFFQAEDGMRDRCVTGVQTCALPISGIPSTSDPAVVGGVNPKKAGSEVDGIPVFATVAEAMAATGADVTVIFVPPAFAKSAVIEAIEIGRASCRERV